MTHQAVAATPEPAKSDDRLLIAYIRLRTYTGRLAMALPFVVFLGALIVYATPLQPSISAYYYSGMTSVFNGTLWAIATFLFIYNPAKEDPLYRDYEKAKTDLHTNRLTEYLGKYGPSDEVASNWAAIFALCITLFPTLPPSTCVGTLCLLPEWVGKAHVIFAALFFAVLIYFALYLFRKTHADSETHGALTPNKIRRNRVYLICGLVMLICTVLILLLGFIPMSEQPTGTYSLLTHAVFFLETIAIEAFGFSWLVKGEVILKDDDDIHTPRYLLTSIYRILGFADLYDFIKRLLGRTDS